MLLLPARIPYITTLNSFRLSPEKPPHTRGSWWVLTLELETDQGPTGPALKFDSKQQPQIWTGYRRSGRRCGTFLYCFMLRAGPKSEGAGPSPRRVETGWIEIRWRTDRKILSPFWALIDTLRRLNIWQPGLVFHALLWSFKRVAHCPL